MKRFMLLLVVLTITLAHAAVAAPIAVGNYSFETPTTTGLVHLGPGWNGYTETLPMDSNNGNIYVTRADAYGITSGKLDGQQIALMTPYTYESGQEILQVLTDTLQVGTYTLTVAAGLNNIDGYTAPADAKFGLRSYTYNGGDVFSDLGFRTVLSDDLPARGWLDDFVMQVNVLPGNSHLGERVTIILASPYKNANPSVLSYDNVRLDYISTVPEPSTVAMLFSGIAGLLAASWRKRK